MDFIRGRMTNDHDFCCHMFSKDSISFTNRSRSERERGSLMTLLAFRYHSAPENVSENSFDDGCDVVIFSAA